MIHLKRNISVDIIKIKQHFISELQRKLLLSEVEFLSNYLNDIKESSKLNSKHVVIYAGAGPGLHIPLLVSLFPIFEYVLIDPTDFKFDSNKHNGHVETINEYFDDAMAKKFKEKYVHYEILFISDIRTANYRQLTRLDTEIKVEQDMVDQMRWYRILNPIRSLLKFRLPYVGNKVPTKTELEYLDGKIYLQVWEGITSSETRLVVEQNAGMKTYDCIKYENMLYRFNIDERVCLYRHDVRMKGFDYCYDCRTEVFILNKYLRLQHKVAQRSAEMGLKLMTEYSIVEDLISKINNELNAKCRVSMLTYKGKNYKIKFLEMSLGADLDCIFHPSKIVYSFVQDGWTNESDETEDTYLKKLNYYDRCSSIHCLQAGTLRKIEYDKESFEKRRELADDFPESAEKNTPSKNIDKTTVYYKQRGIHLSIVEFLVNACVDLKNQQDDSYKYKKIIFVYLGAASCSWQQWSLIQSMFPFIKFVLYDPIKIESVKTTENLIFYQEKFDYEKALEFLNLYSDYVRLFGSNIKIRTTHTQPENITMEDLRTCFINIEPFRALQRFNLEYQTSKTIKFLAGKHFIGIWSYPYSKETSLVVNDFKINKEYDITKMKNQINRFNKIERVYHYQSQGLADNENSIAGFDSCYDCTAEMFVFEKYISCLDERQKLELKGSLIVEPRKHSQILNDCLKSQNETFQIVYNDQKYEVKFTDIRYGLKFSDVCNEKSVIKTEKRKLHSEGSTAEHQNETRGSFQGPKTNRASSYHQYYKRPVFKRYKQFHPFSRK